MGNSFFKIVPRRLVLPPVQVGERGKHCEHLKAKLFSIFPLRWRLKKVEAFIVAAAVDNNEKLAKNFYKDFFAVCCCCWNSAAIKVAIFVVLCAADFFLLILTLYSCKIIYFCVFSKTGAGQRRLSPHRVL